MSRITDKLEQARQDKALVIVAADKEIARLEAEIEAKVKPKLKHGDYGRDTDGVSWMVLLRKGFLEVFDKICGSGVIVKDAWPTQNKLGNIFDDLERNSEDLEEFDIEAGKAVSHQKGDKLEIGLSIKPRNLLYITTHSEDRSHYMHFDIDQATEIHQKLGQMIASSIRKESK